LPSLERFARFVSAIRPQLSFQDEQRQAKTMDNPDKDLLWKQYTTHIDLYKTYLDLALKINAFYYITTGGILSFFFSKVNASSQITPNIIKYALLFPVLISAFLIIVFTYGAIILQITRRELFAIRDRLNLDSAPEFNVLAVILILSSFMMLIVLGGMLYLLCKY
jgi:hypothetical protein